MVHQIHPDEPDTSEAVVRALLATECSQWANLHLQHLDSSGTQNAVWRGRIDGGPDLVVRLPRHPGAAEGAALEHQLLQQLEATPLASIVSIPQLLHVGSPHELYPYRWSVLAWLDGRDAWTARHEIDEDSPRLGARLAEVVTAIGALGHGLPVPKRAGGERGIPIRPHIDLLLEQLDRAGPIAGGLVDIGRVRQLATEAYELDDPTTTCFIHDDLIPGNLLVQKGHLTAVLDWGSACYGDPARDLAPAWSILGPKGRQVFREILLPDEASWARGRVLELGHAVDAVLHYLPSRHVVGNVFAATLNRILADS
ncbi:MAG TPA: phosphotransferase [Acidimicrobiales bacterium]|nr:phosphotransferase [Acidimicrobiales bacterium]